MSQTFKIAKQDPFTMNEEKNVWIVLLLNTLCTSICVIGWLLSGILIVFLIENEVFQWDHVAVGWLFALPILSASLFFIPFGVLSDKFGSRFFSAFASFAGAILFYFFAQANTYSEFLGFSFGFGILGAALISGISFNWNRFQKGNFHFALGIFQLSFLGVAVAFCSLPYLLEFCTQTETQLEGWRTLPKGFALLLGIIGVAFLFFTPTYKNDSSFKQRFFLLKKIRIWRFGFYYSLFFGAFFLFVFWLTPYYLHVYFLSWKTSSLLTAIVLLPFAFSPLLGQKLATKFGARRLMYWVLGLLLICCCALMIPKMDIKATGKSVRSSTTGTVIAISDKEIQIGEQHYAYQSKLTKAISKDKDLFIFPQIRFWQEPQVKVGDKVERKQWIALGVLQLYFQANYWIFTLILVFVTTLIGLGKSAVEHYIPDYFPETERAAFDVIFFLAGVGSSLAILFISYLLQWTGIWMVCWLSFSLFLFLALVWMHRTIQKMMHHNVPTLMYHFDEIPEGHIALRY